MGTRGSPLALAQSGQAARKLESLNPGLKVETIIVKTSGDLFGAPPPEVAKTLPQGAKGLWVKEIEQALLDGTIDFACHSAKDLPALLADGLSIAAYPEREDPRDAMVAREGLTWKSLKPGMKIATSSLRRQLMIEKAVPGVTVLPLRGNVDTRLRKLTEGEFDAMIIALAGLKRLGRDSVKHEPIDPAIMLPAPAQGSLALEIKESRKDIRKIVGTLDHPDTRRCVEFERAFLAEIGGGCGAPVAAFAQVKDGGVMMECFFAVEGTKGKRVKGVCSDLGQRAAFVRDLASQVRK